MPLFLAFTTVPFPLIYREACSQNQLDFEEDEKRLVKSIGSFTERRLHINNPESNDSHQK